MVARDGIEPPTPAFSGLDSISVIFLADVRISHRCLLLKVPALVVAPLI